MLGHLLEWFYSGLGGIRQENDAVAFKHIKIHPDMVKGVTHAETSYASPYGLISTAWKKEGTGLSLDVEIPANTTATIYIPATAGQQLIEGNKTAPSAQLRYEKGRILIRTGSGKYHFTVH